MTTLTDMQAEILQRFRLKPAWEQLADTEMVTQLSDLLGALFYETKVEVENARSDAFLSTAVTRPAVLTHAADRGFLPPKPQPPNGVVALTNGSTTDTILVPAGFQFLDSEGISYLTEEAISLVPSGVANVRVQQLTPATQNYSGSSLAYQEFRVADWSLVDLTGIVTMSDGTVEPIEFVEDFWNTSQDTWAGQLFYTNDDQWMLRLGNGEFGRMLTAGDLMTLEMTLTRPNHQLLMGNDLYPVNTLLDSNGLSVTIAAKVVQPIGQGIYRATTNQIRQDALAYRNLAQRMVWREDYIHLLRSELPDLGFVNVWGEAEQEIQEGKKDYSNTNTIFVSAYSSTSNADVSLRVLDTLQAAPHPITVKYRFVPAIAQGFTLLVSGRVPKGTSLGDLQTAISNVLLTHYGKNSPMRKRSFQPLESYEELNNSGVLANPYDSRSAKTFTVEVISGNIEPSLLQGYVYLESINFNINNF